VPGPIAWWKAEGNASDSAGANHGVLRNGTAFAAGRVGQAFSLDGINDYMSIPDSGSLRPASLTIEGWFKFSATNGVYILAAKALGSGFLNSFAIWLEYGALRAHVGDSSSGGEILTHPSFRPNPGEWYHVAYAFDDAANFQALYVNGGLGAQGVQSKTIDWDGHDLVLGADFDFGTGGGFLFGEIDEVTIFPRSLSTGEIQTVFNNGARAKDYLAPVITCPSNRVAQCDTWTNLTLMGTATAIDDCDPNVAVAFTDTVPGGVCSPPMVITRTWKATDCAGNMATCTQTINITNAVPAFVYLYVEAESGTEFSPITVGSEAQASGGQYIYTSTSSQGRATYSVNIPSAGSYFMWWRAFAPSSASNSFYLNLYATSVNTAWTNICDIPPQAGWRWSRVNRRSSSGTEGTGSNNVRVLQLAQGPMNFVIGGREIGTRLDRILITNDPNFVPTDTLGPPEIVVTVGGNNVKDGQGTAIDFGSVVQGQPGPSKTFTVRNDGGQTLSLGSVGLPAGYTLTEGLATSLAPGASDPFTVRLNSATVGTQSGQVILANNDSDENPFNFPISGVVTAVTPPAPLVKVRFEEASGTATTNTGTLGGTLTLTTPVPARSTNVPEGVGGTRSVDFGTTTGNYVVESPGVLSALAKLTKFTITGWVNNKSTNQGSRGNRIVTWINNGGDGVDLVYLSNGSLKIGIDQWPDSGTASSAGRIPTDASAQSGNWRFFAVTYDRSLSSGHVKFYFGTTTTDASLDVARNYNRGAVGANIHRLAIGHLNSSARSSALDRMLRGVIDEIRIYGTNLPLAEIIRVQQDGTAPASFGPTEEQFLPRIASIEILEGGAVYLQVSGQAGRHYQIQAARNLLDWIAVGEATADERGRFEFVDIRAGEDPCRFYRVRKP
jgi:hypothetical protein